MELDRILMEFEVSDRRYPINNLTKVLNKLFPEYTVYSETDQLQDGVEITSLKLRDLLEIRYQTKGNSYILSIRFNNGSFWILNESEETLYPELNTYILNDIIRYSRKDQTKEKDDIFKYESDSGHVYTVDTKAVTCDCPHYRYRTSHYPVSDERRLCKHLGSVLRCYPEFTPKSISSNDGPVKSQDGKIRYPRAIFDMYIIDIRSVMEQFDGIIERYEICGSYRRLAPMVSDLDLLIQLKSGCNWDKLLEYIENIKGWKLIKEIGKGEAKAAYMIDGFVHLDMKCINEENWPFALMHFTGSKSTNIEMRRAANLMGYKLNEYGLFSEVDGRPVSGLLTEKDVYHFLGVPYVEPWNR